jgi:GAF domain-containing protein
MAFRQAMDSGMTVGRDRWWRIATTLAGPRQGGPPLSAGLCSRCVEALSVAGAGITVMASGGAQVSLCASDPTVRQLAELEFTLGHGPAGDAYQGGVPVLEVDLVNAPPMRWAAFTGPALDAGIAAVFAFPLRIGAARLGALILYQTRSGAMADATYADALVAAEVITRAVLTMQAGMPEEALMADLADASALHAEVHQASGMVSVQLGVGVSDALTRLRARAFALDRPIADVAADVVNRRMRFDD